MVFAKRKHSFPTFSTHNSPAISYIGNVAHVLHYKNNNSTGATFVNYSLIIMGQLQEFLLSLAKASPQGLLRVGREVVLPYDILMEVIP